MTRIIRHEVGSKKYFTGVNHGVFYPAVGPGVPWNGLLSIKESVSDVDTKITYMDGYKVQTDVSLGTFAAQLSALTYPLEFEDYDGFSEFKWSGQPRKSFGLAYCTSVGNEEEGMAFGYQIHLVFNALAAPTSREYTTISSGVDPTAFEWSITTTPVFIADYRPASHLVIDSTKAYPAALAALEDILYGTSIADPRFPTMQEVLDLFESYAIFKVTDHGDGIATISGPDSAVFMTGVDSAQFTWPSVVQVSEDTYRLTSL